MTKPVLDYLFHPGSVAVAGVSSDMSQPSGGRVFAEIMLKAGFTGPIYLVGRGGGELFGQKIYPAITDIPGTVDLIISAVPARSIPQFLRDGTTRGVRTVHLFTAGFSETGTDEGHQLESQIVELARQSGIRLIGPNCMGLYCPGTGLSFGTEFSHRSGPVGYLAQSGGHSLYGVIEANNRGIYFSKAVSSGNAADLNESDFLDYLTEDEETRIIAIYLEGVRDAGRFAATLRRACRLKPVVVYKGGQTATGARTALSHTGAIAGSAATWSALIRQAGAVEVHSVAELVDMLALFRFMAPPSGKRVAVMGLGGGVSVQAADDCLSAGLEVPLLPPEVSAKLRQGGFTEAGKMFQNPVDVFSHGSGRYLNDIVDALVNSGRIDILLPHLTFDQYPVPGVSDVELYVQTLTRLPPEVKARMAVILHVIATARSKQAAANVQSELAAAGLPVFPSFQNAASAIVKYIDYCRRNPGRER